MSVRISARLPGGDRDGLQTAERDLRELRDPILVVAELYPRSIADVLDSEADPYLVTLGIRAIEVLTGDDGLDGQSFLAGTYEGRTGRMAIPFGVALEDNGES